MIISTPNQTRGSSPVPAFASQPIALLAAGSLLTACLLASAQPALSLSPDSKTLHAKAPKGDLPNFHEVHPFLYRSGEPTLTGLQTVRDKYNVKTIIDLRGSPRQIAEEKAMSDSLGLNYINLPMSDKPPTKSQVTTMMKSIRDSRDGKAPGAVLVHCAHGSDRTGCMIGIWRVTEDHYTYDQAYKEMRKYWFTPKFTMLSGTVRKAAEAGANAQYHEAR